MRLNYERDSPRKIRQLRERHEVQSAKRAAQELLQKRNRQQSWIKPWLHACRHIRTYSNIFDS